MRNRLGLGFFHFLFFFNGMGIVLEGTHLGSRSNHSLVIVHCLPRHAFCWRVAPRLFYFSLSNTFTF